MISLVEGFEQRNNERTIRMLKGQNNKEIVSFEMTSGLNRLPKYNVKLVAKVHMLELGSRV